MSIPEPKAMKQYAVDAVRLLLYTERSDNPRFEALLAEYSSDSERLTWLLRIMISTTLNFGEANAKRLGVTREQMFETYLKEFDEGSGWPLSEYL